MTEIPTAGEFELAKKCLAECLDTDPSRKDNPWPLPDSMGADVLKISIRIVLAELDAQEDQISELQRQLDAVSADLKASERKAQEYLVKLNERGDT